MKNKLYSAIGLVAFAIGLVSLSAPVFASEPTSVDLNVPKVVSPSVTTENNVSIDAITKLSVVKKRGDMLIRMRLHSLAAIESSLKWSKLTADQKASLKVMIDEQSTNLSALKVQIDASTDLMAAKNLVKSIYTDFRIYAVFIPKVKAMIALDMQANHEVKVQAYIIKVQARLDALKAKGKDVTARQAALDKVKVIANTIKPEISEVMVKASNLMPSDYPTTYKAEISAIRAGIKDIQLKFKAILSIRHIK